MFPGCEDVCVILNTPCKMTMSLPESLKQYKMQSCHPSASATAHSPRTHSAAHIGLKREWKTHKTYFSYFIIRRGNTSWKTVSNLGSTMNLNGSLWGACSLSCKQPWHTEFLELAYLNSVWQLCGIKQHPKNKAYIIYLPCWAWKIAQCLHATKMVSLEIHSHYTVQTTGEALAKLLNQRSQKHAGLSLFSFSWFLRGHSLLCLILDQYFRKCSLFSLSKCIRTTQYLVTFITIWDSCKEHLAENKYVPSHGYTCDCLW